MTKSAIAAFFGHREREQGGLSHEERAILALAWCGPAAPLAELARAAGVSGPATKPDSARKQARRVYERLEARGLVVTRDVRACFADCTHVSTPGHKGRKECQALRRQLGVTSGCVAHHGHTVRMPVLGLTRAELVRRLELPADEVTRRVAQRRAEERAERELAGIPANDAEARAWCGQSPARGPRGTNGTSARRLRLVPPIPPEGLSEIEKSASQEGSGETRAAAPSARKVRVAEPTPPNRAAPGGRESTGGGRARGVPIATVTAIAEARAARATVEWFRAAWKARGLPPLNALELRQVLWCRAKQFSRDDLALGLARAVRVAWTTPLRAFARVFADRGVLAELVHEERRERDATEASAKRGGAPSRVSPGGRARGGGSADPAGGADGAPPKSPRRTAAGLLTDAEFQRRQAEQHEVLLELEAGTLIEVPVIGNVK